MISRFPKSTISLSEEPIMGVNEAARSTVLLAVWLVAYIVIGGAVFMLSNELMRLTAMSELLAISVSVALAVLLGWLAASRVQRMAARRIARPHDDSRPFRARPPRLLATGHPVRR